MLLELKTINKDIIEDGVSYWVYEGNKGRLYYGTLLITFPWVFQEDLYYDRISRVIHYFSFPSFYSPARLSRKSHSHALIYRKLMRHITLAKATCLSVILHVLPLSLLRYANTDSDVTMRLKPILGEKSLPLGRLLSIGF